MERAKPTEDEVGEDAVKTSRTRREWLEERRKGIGASDAPCLLPWREGGYLSRYGSPVSVVASKLQPVGEVEEEGESWWEAREREVAEWAAREANQA